MDLMVLSQDSYVDILNHLTHHPSVAVFGHGPGKEIIENEVLRVGLVSLWGFPGGTSGKEPADPGDIADAVSVPGWRRSPGGGHDNSLQYSYLENPMDRTAWWPIVHRVAKSRTRLM